MYVLRTFVRELALSDKAVMRKPPMSRTDVQPVQIYTLSGAYSVSGEAGRGRQAGANWSPRAASLQTGADLYDHNDLCWSSRQVLV